MLLIRLLLYKVRVNMIQFHWMKKTLVYELNVPSKTPYQESDEQNQGWILTSQGGRSDADYGLVFLGLTSSIFRGCIM